MLIDDKIPFYDIAKSVLARRDISCGEKVVFLRLMLYSGNTGKAYPSMEVLADDVGGDVQQTRRYIRRLEEKGVISVERKVKCANRYTIINTIKSDTIKSDTIKSDTIKNDHSILSKTIGRKENRKIYNIYTQMSNDDAQMSNDDKSVFPFADFWKLYPRKVEKKRAEKTYSRLPEASRAAIKDRLPDFVKKWQSVNPRFIPYPTTWLNGERWNDEEATTNSTTAPTATEMLNQIRN